MTNLDADYIVQARRNHAPRTVIAEICGVTTGALKRFMVAKGIDDRRKNKSQHAEARCQRLARLEGFRNLTEAIWYYRMEKGLRRIDIAKRFKVSMTTIDRHYPYDLKGKIFVKSKAWKSATMNNIKLAQERNRK